MSVQNTNSQYSNMVDVWRKIDDVCGGSREVKAKRTVYLPMINACDNSEENIARYNAYLTRAVFYPIAKDTVQNNVGLAFSEDPTFEPDGLDFLKTDADGSGVSIYQLNQIALKGLIKHARGGFFVDYPSTEGMRDESNGKQTAWRKFIGSHGSGCSTGICGDRRYETHSGIYARCRNQEYIRCHCA